MGDKRAQIAVVLTLGLLSSMAMAAGVPAGWGTHNSGLSPFTSIPGGTTVAEVTWHVYSDYGSGSGLENNSVYAYQITNTSNTGLSFFSVQIPVGAAIGTADYDSTMGNVSPNVWGPVGAVPQSVEGFFTQTIAAGQSSGLLWFVSNKTSQTAQGALAGISGGYVFAQGEIMAPVPEPATIAMLGIGGIGALLRKRR